MAQVKKYQTKRVIQQTGHATGYKPYSQQDFYPEPVHHPKQEGPSCNQDVAGFLHHDEATVVDPYAVRTQGSTNGYRPSTDSDDLRRRRGNGHNGIYLDEAAPRDHERTILQDHQDPRRRGAFENERTGFGSDYVEETSDFYYGASHPVYKKDPLREPRSLDERHMTKMEKYEVDLKKKLMQDDLADASRDALEEAAYQRAQDREEAKRFQQQQEAYNPWEGTPGGGQRTSFHMNSVISGATDYGGVSGIPAPDQRQRDVVQRDPFRSDSGKRELQGEYSENTDGAYAEQWYDQGDGNSTGKNHRRMIPADAPTATFSQNEMVRVRAKEEALGNYRPVEAHRKSNYLETGRQFVDAGVSGPPLIGNGELNHKQVARPKHNDFNHAGDYIASKGPEHEFQAQGMPEPKGLGLQGAEDSLYSYDNRSHPFAVNRPNQRW